VGVYDRWVRQSFAALAQLKPARYGKTERVQTASAGLSSDGWAAPASTLSSDSASGARADAANQVANSAANQAAYQAAYQAEFDTAVAALNAGQAEQAEARFSALAAQRPQDIAVLVNRGISLRQAGRFSDARAAYERALELAPADTGAALNLAILLDLYLGQAAPAQALLQRCLDAAPAGDSHTPLLQRWLAEMKNRKPPAQVAQRQEPA